jgi:hypothetical protein
MKTWTTYRELLQMEVDTAHTQLETLVNRLARRVQDIQHDLASGRAITEDRQLMATGPEYDVAVTRYTTAVRNLEEFDRYHAAIVSD